MLETLLHALTYFFIEILFQGILLRAFKGVRLTGLYMLKWATFSSAHINELKQKYKDSSLPYFLGFAVWIGLALLIRLAFK